MVLVAALAHDAASIALAVIGGAWLALGGLGSRQLRRTVRQMTFDGAGVRFTMAREDRYVALADLREFKWSRYDIYRVGPMRAVTSAETYLIAARCEGLIDFFVALRTANHALKLPL